MAIHKSGAKTGLMPEKPDGKSISDKALSNKGQEPTNALKHDGTESPSEKDTAAEPASKKLAETAWAPGSEAQIASAQVLPPGFPQPELVTVVEGQVVKPGEITKSWDLSDQQVTDTAKQIRQALERRSFGGLGGPDPDTAQIARLVEGLKLSDRRAIEMVLNKQEDLRQQLEKLLVNKPDELKNLINIFDRPDRADGLPLDNAQAVHYARRVIESLRGFSKEGAEAAAHLLAPLNKAERQQIENEMSSELKMPFRDWLHRQMPVGHHVIGLNNESIARIEATLDQPDTGTDYKGSVKILIGGLKDNWSASKENAILHIVSGMDGKEIRDSGIFKELRTSPYLSKTAQQVLDVTLAGRDKWTANGQQARELAETALKTKNLEIFKDAMQSKAARDYFKSPEGAKKIDQIYSGPFDARDRQVAHDYAELNDTKLLTDLQMYQFSLSPSNEAITQRLMSATDEEKKLFQKGRELADLRPKDTDEERAASRYYLDTFEALRSASRYNSDKLKEWTGLLLEPEAKAGADHKPNPRQQIIDDNRNGLTGLDAVRRLQETLRQNPELAKTLSDGTDKELKAAYDATVKRIADDSRNSAIGGAIWKEVTDLNNYNPVTSLMSAPEHQKRQQEFVQNAASSTYENLQKQLLTQGQLSLEQKLFVAGDKKLSADDLLSLTAGEKQRLLQGQYSPRVQEAVFGKTGPESEFIRNVLAKQDAQLTQLDQVRAFALGRGQDVGQVESLFAGMKAAQRKMLSDQYFDKYKSAMNPSVLDQIKDPVDKARVIQSLRHADETAEQKLVNAQIEQTKHASPFDALSEAYSPDQRMANKYARTAESFYHQAKDGLTDKQKESLDKLPPEKRQEIAQALMKYQSALKKYWSAQKDYTRNKEEMSEQLADATLTAGAVIASIAQPELSPALLARTAVLSAAGRLGIKQAIMDKDFDTSQASIEKELYKGTMTGVLNSLGGEAFTSGRFIALGKFGAVSKNAAEKTISDLAANQTLKSVIREDAAQVLNDKLEQTTMNKVFGSQKRCMENATEIARAVAPEANAEQLSLIAKSIQQHRKQEVLNTFKGKFWHEGDQLATSITASVAGATFAEMASTAVGYESPSTLLKRLELSSQAGAVGGAVFHIGFKAVGKGVEGLSVIIAKDKQGRLYAGPGTHIRTAEGKEIVVGKEPHYFEPNENVVEFKRDTRPRIDAPPFLMAGSMPPGSDFTAGPIPPGSSTSALERIRPKPEVKEPTPAKSDPYAAFDKISDAHKKNLANLDDDKIDFYIELWEGTLPKLSRAADLEKLQQTLGFLNLVKLARQRERAIDAVHEPATPTIKSVEKPTIQDSKLDDLSFPRAKLRTTSEKSPETIRQIALTLQINEGDVKLCYSVPTSELRKIAERTRESYQNNSGELKDSFGRLSTFTNLAEIERLDHFRFKHPSVAPEQVEVLTRKSLAELSLYRTFTEATMKATKQEKLKAQYKSELALIRELEAEHLTKTLDANLGKRISPTDTPSIGEEIRLLWQFNLRNMRDGINTLLDKETPNDLNAARLQIIESRLDKIDGVPKPKGSPVPITENLVALPWQNGEILYTSNRVVTINDHAAKTSRTLNSSGQLIESFNNAGELRQFTYESPKTNIVQKMTYNKGTDVITYVKDQGSYHGTVTHADGTQEIQALPTITKIEAHPDGSYSAHNSEGHTTVFPDGSKEFHKFGKRTDFEASHHTEEVRLQSNIKVAFKDIEESRPKSRKNESDQEIAARQKLLATNRQERFTKLVSDFQSVAKTNNISIQDQANFYKHLNRLLEDGNDYAIKSKAGRRDLAEQVLYNATHTRDIDQGQNNTCNVTTVEKRCWARYPAQMAQFAADLAEKGIFITSSGKAIDMTQFLHGIRPDIESRQSLKLQREGNLNAMNVDGKRNWLSQMTQIAMVNTGWRELSILVTPKDVLRAPDIVFDKGRKLLGQIDANSIVKIYDENDLHLNRWDGTEKIYDDKHQLLNITKDDLAYDSDGHVLGVIDRSKVAPLYDANHKVVNRKLVAGDVIYLTPGGEEAARHTQFGDIEYGKVGNPTVSVKTKEKLKDQEVLMYRKGTDRQYCKDDKGSLIRSPNLGVDQFLRISEEFTGIKESEPFVVIRTKTSKQSDTRVDIATKEDLEKTIKNWQDKNMLPGIIYVHAGKPPFNYHFDPKDATALRHGWHVINAWGLENGMVDITNQWGKKHNMKISLDELFEAMTDPTGRTGG